MRIIENPQLVVEHKFPWFIDMFLYPVSTSGIIHLIIFLFVPYRFNSLGEDIFSIIYSVGALLILIIRLLVIGYVFYYFGECIRDSAKGNWRAPDIFSQSFPDRGELFSQIFLVFGSLAICFWPVAVYYIYTEQMNLIYWILLVGGVLFFPMSILRAVVFNEISALNPFLLITSIVKTFLPYFGMVLLCCLFGGLIILLRSVLPKSLLFFILLKMAVLYLTMVMCHLLGWFYWWYKDRLDWGI